MRALLVIDVQNEYFSGRLPVTHPAGSFDNILRAMAGARQAGVLVVVVQHAGKPEAPAFAKGSLGYDLHPLIAEQPRDLLIEKTMPGSFTNTPLGGWLKERGVTHLTITGYMTQMCCDTTARQGFHMGYQCEFLSDATGTLDIANRAGSVTAEELHRAILVTQAMRFSEVMTTEEWLARVRA